MNKVKGRPKGSTNGSESLTVVGLLLTNSRVRQKIGQSDIAKTLGVTVAFISNLEKGKAPLPSKYVLILSDRLNINTSTLVEAILVDAKHKILSEMYKGE